MTMTVSVSGADFAADVINFGQTAVMHAAGKMFDVTDASALPNNILSTIGELISRDIRRLILHRHLKLNGWNLSRTAQIFNISGGAASVLREIKRLDLTNEYEAAKITLGLRPGGPRDSRKKKRTR